jgi:serine/threonine protein kinase
MGDISSDHVVKLADGTKTANNIYLLMECCNGGDLDHLKKIRGGHLKEIEARMILQ